MPCPPGYTKAAPKSSTSKARIAYKVRNCIPLTLGETGYLFGISRERVRQVENVATLKFCRSLAKVMREEFPDLCAAMFDDVTEWDEEALFDETQGVQYEGSPTEV